MTDKEKLDAIRAEIHRLVDVRGYDKGMANDLFAFMDSLPNEPVNKDFEMALAEMIDKAQKCVVEPLVVAEQWKDELIKLAKSEEPVSEQNLFNVQSFIKKWKEPVSEELEEAIGQSFTFHENQGDDFRSDKQIETTYRYGFETGAKWQEVKDDEEKVLIYKHGFEDCKEQMMKDAVDACVTDIRTYKRENEVDFTVMYEKGIIPYEMEQEVKVIVIKD